MSSDLFRTVDRLPVVFEKEFEVQYQGDRNLPYTVTRADDGAYVVEGPRIEKMLGYTNLDSEKGFDFFQKFLKNTGVLDELEEGRHRGRRYSPYVRSGSLIIINKVEGVIHDKQAESLFKGLGHDHGSCIPDR
ncbi:MAG: DUF1967 domain-containing protein [Enterocloster sp.]